MARPVPARFARMSSGAMIVRASHSHSLSLTGRASHGPFADRREFERTPDRTTALVHCVRAACSSGSSASHGTVVRDVTRAWAAAVLLVAVAAACALADWAVEGREATAAAAAPKSNAEMSRARMAGARILTRNALPARRSPRPSRRARPHAKNGRTACAIRRCNRAREPNGPGETFSAPDPWRPGRWRTPLATSTRSEPVPAMALCARATFWPPRRMKRSH